jgi:hypothetical protein
MPYNKPSANCPNYLFLCYNSSEQALRWSVIFRKVTNGFRSDWGRDLFAAVRSIVNTGKRQGFSAFESILIALNQQFQIQKVANNTDISN